MSNSKRSKHLYLTVACVATMAAFSAFAGDGDKSKVKGMITAVQGDTVTVRDDNNIDHTIMLTSTTEIKKKEGLAAVRFERMEKSALMPGLPIVADVVEKGGQQEAKEISFRADRMRTAQQVQAGVDPTAQQAEANKAGVAANAARMNEFGTYEALATADVLFASGSTTISAQGKSDLMALASKAKGLKDYRVVMQGFTDSTGDAAANQQLSTRRANAVANFLREQAGLSPGRVQTGAGMGVAPDAGGGSNANARKVEVKLVVDKGVMGDSNK